MTVRMRGDFEVMSLTISPDLVKDGDVEMLQDLTVEPGGSTTLVFRCYAGPKKLQILSQLPNNVDKVMGIARSSLPAWDFCLVKVKPH